MKCDRLWRWQARSAPYLFVLPFVAVFSVFLVYPAVRSLVLSFQKTAGPRSEAFVGLANYRFLLLDLVFWFAVANTVAFTLLSLLIQIPSSLGLAMLLNKPRVRMRGVFRFAFFATHVVGNVFLAVLFAMLFSPRSGLVNRALGSRGLFVFLYMGIQVALSVGIYQLVQRAMGNHPPTSRRIVHTAGQILGAALLWLLFWPGSGLLVRQSGLFQGEAAQVNWLGDAYLVLPVLVLASLWVSVGWGMIYFLAALQAVDQELYEAAEVDGAGTWSKFRHVTLPGIRPVLVFMILVGTIGGFQLFELPYVLFQGSAGPRSAGLTIVMYLFQNGFEAGDLGYASAIGWVLLVLILGVAIVQVRMMRVMRD